MRRARARGGRSGSKPVLGLGRIHLEIGEKARELTTWISEEGPDADLDLARRAAPFFAVKAYQAEAIIDEVAAALKGWRSIARGLGMSGEDIAIYSTAIRADV